MAILALQNPTYQPAMRIVTAITQSLPCVVTTSFDHNYKTGDIVRINIAEGNPMTQINQQYAQITVLSPTTFSMPIDTRPYDVFVVPPDNTPQKFYSPSQVTPIGENNSILYLATQNVLRNPRP